MEIEGCKKYDIDGWKEGQGWSVLEMKKDFGPSIKLVNINRGQ